MGDKMIESCIWIEDPNGIWWAACGHSHCFFDGGPTENTFAFCPYCGRRIEERPYKEVSR